MEWPLSAPDLYCMCVCASLVHAYGNTIGMYVCMYVCMYVFAMSANDCVLSVTFVTGLDARSQGPCVTFHCVCVYKVPCNYMYPVSCLPP